MMESPFQGAPKAPVRELDELHSRVGDLESSLRDLQTFTAEKRQEQARLLEQLGSRASVTDSPHRSFSQGPSATSSPSRPVTSSQLQSPAPARTLFMSDGGTPPPRPGTASRSTTLRQSPVMLGSSRPTRYESFESGSMLPAGYKGLNSSLAGTANPLLREAVHRMVELEGGQDMDVQAVAFRLRYLDLHVANQEQTLEGLRLHVQRIDADRRLQAAAVQEQQDAQDRQLAEVEARLAGLEQGEGAGGMGAGSSRAQALQHVSRAMDALQAMVAHLEQHTVRGIEQRLATISTMLQLPEQEPEAVPEASQAATPAEPSQGAAPAERLQYVEHSLALVKHMISELYELLTQARPASSSETIPAYRAESEAVKGGRGPAAAAAVATAAAAPLLLELSKLQQQLEGQEGRASGQEVAVQQLGVVSAQLLQRVEALEAGLAKGSAGEDQEGVYPLNPLYFTADSRPDSRSAVAELKSPGSHYGTPSAVTPAPGLASAPADEVAPQAPAGASNASSSRLAALEEAMQQVLQQMASQQAVFQQYRHDTQQQLQGLQQEAAAARDAAGAPAVAPAPAAAGNAPEASALQGQVEALGAQLQQLQQAVAEAQRSAPAAAPQHAEAPSSDSGELLQRVAQAEAAAEAAQAAASSLSGEVATKLDFQRLVETLRRRLGEQEARAAKADELATLAAEVQEVRQQLADSAGASTAGARTAAVVESADLVGVRQELARLQQQLVEGGASVASPELAAVAAEVQELRQQVAALGAGSEQPAASRQAVRAVEGQVEMVQGQVMVLQARLEGLAASWQGASTRRASANAPVSPSAQQQQQQELEQLQSSVRVLGAQLEGLTEAVAQAGQDPELISRLQALEAQVEAGAAVTAARSGARSSSDAPAVAAELQQAVAALQAEVAQLRAQPVARPGSVARDAPATLTRSGSMSGAAAEAGDDAAGMAARLARLEGAAGRAQAIKSLLKQLSDGLTDVTARLAALESQQQYTVSPGDVHELRQQLQFCVQHTELGSILGSVEALGNAQAGLASKEELAALQRRLSGYVLEEDVGRLVEVVGQVRRQAAGMPSAEELQQLQRRVEQLAAGTTGRGDEAAEGGSGAELLQLQQQVAQLQQDMVAARPADGTDSSSALQEQLAQQAQQLQALAEQVQALQEAAATAPEQQQPQPEATTTPEANIPWALLEAKLVGLASRPEFMTAAEAAARQLQGELQEELAGELAAKVAEGREGLEGVQRQLAEVAAAQQGMVNAAQLEAALAARLQGYVPREGLSRVVSELFSDLEAGLAQVKATAAGNVARITANLERISAMADQQEAFQARTEAALQGLPEPEVLAALAQQAEQLSAAVAQQAERSAAVQQGAAAAAERAQQSAAAVAELQAALAGCRSSIDNLQQELSSRQDSSSSQAQEAAAAANAARADVAELGGRLAAAEQRAGEAIARAQQVAQATVALRQQLQQAGEGQAAQLAELREQLAASGAALQQAVTTLQAQVEGCASQAQLAALAQQLRDDVSASVASLQEDLAAGDRAAAEAALAQVGQLQGQVGAAVEELEQVIRQECIKTDQLANIMAASTDMYQSWAKMEAVFSAGKCKELFKRGSAVVNLSRRASTMPGEEDGPSRPGGGSRGSSPELGAVAAAAAAAAEALVAPGRGRSSSAGSEASAVPGAGLGALARQQLELRGELATLRQAVQQLQQGTAPRGSSGAVQRMPSMHTRRVSAPDGSGTGISILARAAAGSILDGQGIAPAAASPSGSSSSMGQDDHGWEGYTAEAARASSGESQQEGSVSAQPGQGQAQAAGRSRSNSAYSAYYSAASEGPQSATAAQAAQVALQAGLEEVRQQVAGLGASMAEAVPRAELTQQLEALQAQLGDTQRIVARLQHAGPSAAAAGGEAGLDAGELGELRQRLDAVSSRQEGCASREQLAAVARAVQELRRAAGSSGQVLAPANSGGASSVSDEMTVLLAQQGALQQLVEHLQHEFLSLQHSVSAARRRSSGAGGSSAAADVDADAVQGLKQQVSEQLAPALTELRHVAHELQGRLARLEQQPQQQQGPTGPLTSRPPSSRRITGVLEQDCLPASASFATLHRQDSSGSLAEALAQQRGQTDRLRLGLADLSGTVEELSGKLASLLSSTAGGNFTQWVDSLIGMKAAVDGVSAKGTTLAEGLALLGATVQHMVGRLEAVEQQQQGGGAGPGQQQQQRVADRRASSTTVANVGGEVAAQVAELAQRVKHLEEGGSGAGGSGDAYTQLAEQLAELRQQLAIGSAGGSSSTGGNTADSSGLAQQLDGLQQAVAAHSSRLDTLSSGVAANRERLGRLGFCCEELASQADEQHQRMVRLAAAQTAGATTPVAVADGTEEEPAHGAAGAEGQPQLAAQMQEVQEQLAGLAAELRALQAAEPARQLQQQAVALAALQEQLQELAAAPAPAAAAAPAADGSALAALEALLQQQAAALQQVAGGCEELRSQVEAQAQGSGAAVEELRAAVSQQRSKVEGLSLNAEQLQDRLAQVDSKVAAVSDELHSKAAAAQQAAAATSAEQRAQADSASLLAGLQAELAQLAPPARLQLAGRLLALVRLQAERIGQQYLDDPSLAEQLQQVDTALEAAGARLAQPGGDAGPGQAAEALLSVMEQVAKLRSIGSQTHPALQQLVLAHDQQLAALAQQLAASGQQVAEVSPKLAVGVPELAERLARLEAQVGSRRLGAELQGLLGPGFNAASEADVKVAVKGLAAQVEKLSGAVGALQRAGLPMAAAAHSGSGLLHDGGAATSGQVAEAQAVLQEHSRALKGLRTRVMALQEYVDSTQGMVKELHTVHGSLLLKMDAIEAGLAATGYDLPSEARQSRLLPRLQRQMTELSAKVTASAIGGGAATAAAQQVKQLAAGMAEVRGSSGQVAAAVGALQEALPLVAQQLTGLQAQLQEGMAMSGQSLDTLAKQLHTLQHRDPRPQRPSSPFAAMASPGRHTQETLQHMEVELAAMRTAMYASAKNLSEGLAAGAAAGGSQGKSQPMPGPLLLQQVQQLVGKKLAPLPGRAPSISASEIQPASPPADAGTAAAASIGLAAASGAGSARSSSQQNLLELSAGTASSSSRRASQPGSAPGSAAGSRRASVAAPGGPAELPPSAGGSRRASVAASAGPAELPASAGGSRRASMAAVPGPGEAAELLAGSRRSSAAAADSRRASAAELAGVWVPDFADGAADGAAHGAADGGSQAGKQSGWEPQWE